MPRHAAERVVAAVPHTPNASNGARADRSSTGGPRLVVSNGETDAVLVRAALDSNPAAFRTLVERHLGRTVATAHRLLGSNGDAEDVAQESFVRLWNRLGDLEVGAAGVWPWLRRVTFNLCMDRRRSQREIVPDVLEKLAGEDDQQLDLERSEMAQRVGVALRGLPDRQKDAIVLFHYEGYSVKEIAETMGSSGDAVESLLGRARRGLKNSLKEEWQELLSSDEICEVATTAREAEE